MSKNNEGESAQVSMKIFSVTLIVLAVFCLYGAYHMSNKFTLPILSGVITCTGLLMMSGIGLFFRQNWSYFSFLGFSITFLLLVIYSQFGLLQNSWLLFIIQIPLIISILSLFAIKIKKYCKTIDLLPTF